MNLTLFIFHRDLRLEDNTGLIYALKNSELVIPAFIFTPEQIDNNPYRSDHSLQFMIESLEALDKELHKKGSRLYLFYGKPHEVVKECIQKLKIEAVVANRDYTPYSIDRDKMIGGVCKKNRVSFFLFDDALLHPPEQTVKSNGKPYTVFTLFYRHVSDWSVDLPQRNLRKNYFHGSIPFSKSNSLYSKILPVRAKNNGEKGGREGALKILRTLKKFEDYRSVRDFPAVDGTTHLSAYLKFTTSSPREVYHSMKKKLGKDHELIRQLFWRDFFTTIAFFFPHVMEGAFRPKFNKLKWSTDKKAFKKWCKGETGFPLIDAGMREMNETGLMHNRVRLVVASFLVKDLHLNWQWGERYFAQTLLDYDPAVNNGNWQWVASTGCDAQPFFRIFNPWTQQKKFDPSALYIKKWVPELASLPPKIIHEWNLSKHHTRDIGYPLPMVDHEKESKIALAAYRKL